MEKKMYALTYCYEGTDNTNPYGATLAVSEDKDKLIAEMRKCVAFDCEQPNPDDEDYNDGDEWSDDANFIVVEDYETQVVLQHRKNINLYAKYTIRSVDVL